eukprot:11150434-Ditylum_brightwellii.AAC.1
MKISVVKNVLPPANCTYIIEANNESYANTCSVAKHACEEFDKEKEGVDESLIAHKDKLLTHIKGKK